MRKSKLLVGIALATAAVFTVAGCSASETGGSTKKVEIEWWHIQTVAAPKAVWQNLAKSYEKTHPNVTVKITAQDGQVFKTALDARLQAGDPPDIYQTWGGGVLANQASAGFAKDITSEVAPWIKTLKPGPVASFQVNGKQFGVPYGAGLVGFWYNKSLFANAGITTPPTTWPDFLTDVKALKESGTVPIALAAGDKWPAMFYWASLAVAEGGSKAMVAAGKNGNFNSKAFIKAGNDIVQLSKDKPFQDGFLGAAYNDANGQASLVANGKAAMELMGEWAPATEVSVAANGKGLGKDLGWFPFPSIPGGAGGSTEAFGGVNGFAVGSKAPPEALDFLKYISSVESAKKMGATGFLLPVAIGAEGSVKDPAMQVILSRLSKTTFVQNFLDQAYAPAVATAINDNVQQIFAGTLTPEQAADAISTVAKQQ